MTAFHHLMLPEDISFVDGSVDKYAENVVPGTTDMTDAVARAFAVANGGGEVTFKAGSIYYVTDLMQLSGYTNIKVNGNGARIVARLTSTENVWTFLDCDGIEIRDLIFDGGYSVSTFSNQVLSFRDPKNCTIRSCRFTDFYNSAILMFSADYNASGVAKNNHIIDCYCDGTGIARVGFLMESMANSSMVNCWAENVSAADLGYAIEFKNHCTNCQIIGGGAINSRWGIVVLDEAVDTQVNGQGANNCLVRGAVATGCVNGLVTNYSKNCSFDVDIDMQENDDGGIPFTIAAHCVNNNYSVSIKNVHSAATVITTRSDDQVAWIRDWDRTGTTLINIETGVERNRFYLQHVDTNSATFQPNSMITDASGATGGDANFFQDLRDFMYSEIGSTTVSMYFPVPGQSRSTHSIRFGEDQAAIRTGGSDRVQFNNANSGWYPATDNVYDNGISSRRWRNTYTGMMTLIDGVTAPAAIAGHAVMYVDAADGDLKVRYGDGTIKTIVVDT